MGIVLNVISSFVRKGLRLLLFVSQFSYDFQVVRRARMTDTDIFKRELNCTAPQLFHKCLWLGGFYCLDKNYRVVKCDNGNNKTKHFSIHGTAFYYWIQDPNICL